MTEELDYAKLDNLLAKTKTRVFLHKTNATFLGSIMCSLDHIWDEEIETACTNGLYLKWNPRFFLKLDEDHRVSVEVHELWHVARMHMLRLDGRDMLDWNAACDLEINNPMVRDDGYVFDPAVIGFECWLDQYVAHRYPGVSSFYGMSAETIYDIIHKEHEASGKKFAGMKDIVPKTDNNTKDSIATKVISIVIQANTAAQMAGEDVPDAVKYTLKQFLSPKVPWEQHVYRWWEASVEWDYSMRRPNRRYRDVYLPFMEQTEGLQELNYYIDVSGSITDAQVVRFNSEIKYLKETFHPTSLRVVQFDTRIQDIRIFKDEDPFDEIVVVGRGGTSLECVYQDINETQPDGVIIFSDLYCDVMEKVDPEILWIVVNNSNAQVKQGTMVHIKE